MSGSSSRRQWLKTTSTALAGLTVAPGIFATEKERWRAAGIIYLNSNENAYGPSPGARKAMTEAVVRSNRYPDEQILDLKRELAGFYGLESRNILMGAGGSEILSNMNMFASVNRGKIVTADPSFNIWSRQALALGMKVELVPLDKDKKLDLPAMLSAIDGETRMIYVCNPNNPSATVTEEGKLRSFVKECSKKCLVLVDEAYTEYADTPSLKDMAIADQHIVVVKTFSKIYGLAGARIGYALAHPDTISKLKQFQLWSEVSLSAVTTAAAAAALKDQEFTKDCQEKTAKARTLCYSTFKQLGLDYIPSHTNFILFDVSKISADYRQRMEAKNIMVQYRNFFGGRWCRVSMGTLEEMQEFCSALKSIVS